MNAREYAQQVFDAFAAKGHPYYSPELEPEIPNCPPLLKVWDDLMGMIRVIGFAESEDGAVEALSYARDVSQAEDHPEYCWPEARWRDHEFRYGYIEGWSEAVPSSDVE